MLRQLDRWLGGWHLRGRDGASDLANRPHHDRPTGTAGPEDKIDHIVVLMMENHSFDNYFGTLGIGDGLTRRPDGRWEPSNEKANGGVVSPFHLPTTIQHGGVPSQTWNASYIQYAEGA